MNLWTALLDVLILLFAALLLGALCERLKQSALLGYLLAGTLLGPNAFNLMPSHTAVATMAELGVTLLLFSIGLEFSWRRLRSIGPVAVVGGTLQVVLTTAVVAAACMGFGFARSAALAVGAMAALSSTACVLRLLVSRAEIDSVYGRHALGILLLQDIAVVPLVLFVAVLAEGGSASQIAAQAARAAAAALLLTGAMYIVLKYLMPLLITAAETARNRELSVLLAMTTALGTAWLAHRWGLSPVLGAFIAGMLLAESPFAVQIRADVASLRTLFVTLFFGSIGMIADPGWVLDHLALVAGAVAAVVACKTAVVYGVVRLFHSSPGHAAATAICLAQVGEFSFVLADVAKTGGLLNRNQFELVMSVTVATLFLTPYMVGSAPYLATAAGRLSALLRRRTRGDRRMEAEPEDGPLAAASSAAGAGHVVLVGFGPAARRVADALVRQHTSAVVVVELNSKSAALALGRGLRTYIGDATHPEVLEHVHVHAAACVVVTLPDPATARLVIQHVRSLSATTPIIARARYHVHAGQLAEAGADVVVDEENQVGRHLALQARRTLRRYGYPRED